VRSADQPRTKIDVVYGEGKGDRFATIAEMARFIKLLETVAGRTSEALAWPKSFALEAQTCGFPNAAWVQETRKLTVCYELVADFADLYRTYGAAPTSSRKQKSK
jgi:hypothetical protein